MEIAIGRETSFDVPKGKYRAILRDVIQNRPNKHGIGPQVRLLFEIQAPDESDKDYLAGKNYEPTLAPGSSLRKDLASWRGRDLTDEEILSGTLDLRSMIGQPADLQIAHVQNIGFAKPFVRIKAIRPPGKLVKLRSTTSIGG